MEKISFLLKENVTQENRDEYLQKIGEHADCLNVALIDTDPDSKSSLAFRAGIVETDGMESAKSLKAFISELSEDFESVEIESKRHLVD